MAKNEENSIEVIGQLNKSLREYKKELQRLKEELKHSINHKNKLHQENEELKKALKKVLVPMGVKKTLELNEIDKLHQDTKILMDKVMCLTDRQHRFLAKDEEQRKEIKKLKEENEELEKDNKILEEVFVNKTYERKLKELREFIKERFCFENPHKSILAKIDELFGEKDGK